VFRGEGARHARYTAFVEILRGAAWVCIENGYADRQASTNRVTNADLLLPIVSLARDIAQVLDLPSADESKCRSIRASFERVSRKVADQAIRSDRVAETEDVADFRFVDSVELVPAVTLSVLERYPKLAKGLTRYEDMKALVVCMIHPLEVMALPRRDENRLGIFPAGSLPECAQMVLTQLLRKSKLKEAVRNWERPTWRRICPAMRALNAEGQEVTFRLLNPKVAFIPASVANGLYQCARGCQEMWQRAEEGMRGALEFAWATVTFLDRENRRNLFQGTSTAVVQAMDAGRRELAIWGLSLMIGHLEGLSEAEWARLSPAVFHAVETEYLDEVNRRRIAAILADLPENVGRLNRELASAFVNRVFPELKSATGHE